MKTFAQKIAWAYLPGSSQEQSIKTMIMISFLSITLSTCALTLGVFILHGFSDATTTALKNVNADLTIEHVAPKDVATTLDTITNTKGVIGAAPTIVRYVMLKTDNVIIETPLMLKAIDPKREPLTTKLEQKITSLDAKPQRFIDLLHTNQIIMGKKLADILHIIPGDTVALLYADMYELSRNKISFNQKPVTVSTTIATGINELDESLLLCSQELLYELFPTTDSVNINIALKSNRSIITIQHELEKQLGVPVHSWVELYPSLAHALYLEKLGGYFMLSLLVFLSSIGLMSLMYLIITHKKKDIAILRAMGTPLTTIYAIFLYIGILITIAGHIFGIICALGIGSLLKYTSLITLSDLYYTTTLPITISCMPCIIILLFGCTLSCIAIMIPLRSLHSISIPTVLKQE